MTTPIKLGWEPIPIQPIFVFGEDWIINFEPVDSVDPPVFPDGTTVTARLYANDKLETIAGAPLKSLAGEIVDDAAVRFHVEAADGPNTVAKNTYMRISIVYPGTPVVDAFVWATGKVARRD
jgi:hypothetical protein